MIFVAGGSSYVGRFVLRSLLDNDYKLRCLEHRTSLTRDLRARVEVIKGDLDNPVSYQRGLEGVDAVVNVAPIRHVRGLIEACRIGGVRRAVVFSSTWRFSRYRTPAVLAVIEGEDRVDKSELDVTVLRPSMIYGPGDDRNLSRLRDYITRHLVFPVFGTGEQRVQPVYVGDVAAAVLACLEREETIGETYDVVGGAPLSYSQMIDTIARLAGRSVVKVFIPMFVALPLVWTYGRIASAPKISLEQVRRMKESHNYGVEKLGEDLGIRPLSLEEGIERAIQTTAPESRV